jgi:hypothetical protein
VLNDVRRLLFFGYLILVAVDLEETIHPWVIHSQQVYLREYPHAFNPSIARWQGKLILSFRVIPDPKKSFTSYIGLVWLDENFKPISKPQLLRLREHGSKIPSRSEDGRLIVINDVLLQKFNMNLGHLPHVRSKELCHFMGIQKINEKKIGCLLVITTNCYWRIV